MVIVRLTILACALLSTTAAWAAEENGRVEFEEGTRLYRQDEFAAALPWFEQAYALSGHRPATVLALAQCERNLGEHDRAIQHFEEYLTLESDPNEVESVRATIALLRSERVATAPQPEPKRLPTAPARVAQPNMVPQVTTTPRETPVLPLLTIGGGVAVAAIGAVMLVSGREDVRAVENARDGASFRGDLESANGRAPIMTGVGTALLALGIAGSGAGVAWLFDESANGDAR